MIPWLTPDDYFDRYIVTLSPCADYEISNILGDTDAVRNLNSGLRVKFSSRARGT